MRLKMNDSDLNHTDSLAHLWLEIGRGLHPVLSSVGIVGNSMVILCVLRSAVNRTPMNICFASLAAADLLVAVSISATVFFGDFAPHSSFYRKWLCLATLAFATHSALASVLGILVISVKRWGQIVHWNSCHQMSRMKGTMALITGAWGCSFLLSISVMASGKSENSTTCSLDFYLETPHRITLNMIAIFAIAVNAFFCFKLLHHAVKTRRAVHPHAQTAAALERARQNERRLHNTIVIIITILVSLWLPYLILTAIPHLKDTRMKYELVRIWGLALMQMNSLLNPFIYGWRSKSFRDSLLALLPTRGNLSCCRK